jgi:hypothetical protein
MWISSHFHGDTNHARAFKDGNPSDCGFVTRSNEMSAPVDINGRRQPDFIIVDVPTS